MSDYRYDDDSRTRSRSEGRGYSRNSDSIFNYGRDRDRNRDWDRDRGRGEEMGGWAGSGRTSAYDEDERRRGRWTDERENFGWGRSRDRDREQSRHRERGERMGGGWSEGRREEKSRGSGGEYYGPDDRREGLPIDETSRLIASNKVEGTAVYGREGERLGSIYNFMVDKFTGKVEYAVMSYGGFLGMGVRYYPLPWRVLSYDTDRGGYRIHLSERDLRDAPSFDRDTEPRFDRRYGEEVHSWYGLSY